MTVCDHGATLNGGTGISLRTWKAARLAGGAAILAVLVGRFGAGPFVEGLRLTSGWAVAAALGITALTTACCAWRWRLVATGLGADLSMSQAVGGYYRSQFLNATLPGGVLGDVHRGVRHGRAVTDLSRGLRSVAWERTAGQTVQLVLTATVLVALAPSTGARTLTLVALTVGLGLFGLGAVARRRRRAGGRAARGVSGDHVPVAAEPGQGLVRTASRDLRGAVLTRRAAPGIVLASFLVVAGHVAVFAIAARSTGVELPPGRLLPLAVVVLQAAALPANIAGWGPREGASAWAFGAAGLGPAAGVTVAVVFGVLALLATLPGAVLLLTDWRRGRQRGRAPDDAARPATVVPEQAGPESPELDLGPAPAPGEPASQHCVQGGIHA